MKRFSLAAVLTASAAPAFAHTGGHIHPHGFEVAAALGAVAALVAVLVAVKLR